MIKYHLRYNKLEDSYILFSWNYSEREDFKVDTSKGLLGKLKNILDVKRNSEIYLEENVSSEVAEILRRGFEKTKVVVK